jgi:uncharacterized damage-inducible protein DinB/predicted RNase H-like HicB family nuclease
MRYRAYLETANDGRCLAHVLDLPGCVVPAPTREEALCRLPEGIRDYWAWLRRHGEPARPLDEPIQVEVAAERTGLGPFDPGDAAALFPPDREPIAFEEMERTFCLMAYARDNLMALVQDLADDLLDWQPDPASLTLRGLLRHVGNAEEWYVSRLVRPETLPSEWEDDENLPILEFLEMERRTAVARLRQLTEEERGKVFHPARWTSHPEEAWTARKALRRFLEHERQHTAQARRILAAYRRYLLARLATERVGLVGEVLNLDGRVLTERAVHGDWTVKDILAHIAAWDRWEDRTMRCMVSGERPDLAALEDLSASNASYVAESRDRSLDGVLTELCAARTGWVTWLESLPEEQFFRSRSYEGWDWTFYAVPLRVQWQHDAHHAERIADWRKAAGLGGQVGSKAVLLAALAAAREQLLASAARVPMDRRASHPVCGIWTLQDVLGHLADWESFGVKGLRQMAAGQAPQVEHIQDIEAWNRAHAAARHGQSWEVVWSNLHETRRALVGVLEGMSQADLGRRYPFPWGAEGTPYRWVRVYLDHDRAHARGLIEQASF